MNSKPDVHDLNSQGQIGHQTSKIFVFTSKKNLPFRILPFNLVIH